MGDIVDLRTHRPFTVFRSDDAATGPTPPTPPSSAPHYRSDNIRGVPPIPVEHIRRALGDEPLYEPLVDHFDPAELRQGIGEAIGDWISDPRFISGVIAGAWGTVAIAFMVAFGGRL